MTTTVQSPSDVQSVITRPQREADSHSTATKIYGAAFALNVLVSPTSAIMKSAEPASVESKYPQSLAEFFSVQVPTSEVALDQLPDGWDGGGAPRPSLSAIDRANDLVMKLRERAISLDGELMPMVAGGIAFYASSVSRKEIYVEISNEGSVCVMVEPDLLDPEIKAFREVGPACVDWISGKSDG